MARESRVKKSLLNARVNMICYMVSLLVAFFTRKVLLDSLGTEFIGLTGTLSILLGFLNLAELGVGTAIGYVLYKPLFDDDKSKINEIISVFGYIYRWIGMIILGAGVILSAFLPLIYPNTDIPLGTIYIGFYAYLASSMLGYFVNYRQTLLAADQRNYEITGYNQAVTSIKVVLQMVIAIYIRSFILYFCIELIFGIIYSFILTYRVNKVYPWLESDIKLGKQLFKKYPEIGKYVKQLFVHKIATFFQYQITPFLVYSYVSLPMVALYGNYTIITQKLQSCASGVLDGTAAGIGNLISEGNTEKIYSTYKELLSVRFLVAGILATCAFKLCNPFLCNWLGEEYLLSTFILLLICIQFFLSLARGLTDQFINGYGLFYDIWAPATETIIFILASIVCGSLWGLPGVLCGPLISTVVIVYCWKPYFLYTKGFKISILKYIPMFLGNITLTLVAYWSSSFIFDKFYSEHTLSNSWGGWILGAVIFTALMSCFSFVLFYLTSTGFRDFIHRFIKKSSHGKE